MQIIQVEKFSGLTANCKNLLWIYKQLFVLNSPSATILTILTLSMNII